MQRLNVADSSNAKVIPDNDNNTSNDSDTVKLSVAKTTCATSPNSNVNTNCNHGTKETNKKDQRKRKCFLSLCGFLLVLFGGVVIFSFDHFISNEFDRKCLHPSDEWLIKHPELKLYDQYCTKKVVNIFNYSYPCNCRIFNAISPNVSEFTPHVFELSLVHFKNLEGVVLNGENTIYSQKLDSYYFTYQMLNNLNHLIVLFVSFMPVSKINANGIEQLSNLEILLFSDNEVRNVHVPFDAISQLTNLKALVLENVIWSNNTYIPDSICDLTQIVFFKVGFMVYLTNSSLNCISNNWNHLTVFHMNGFPLVTTIFDAHFWHLPSLQVVSVERCDLTPKNFQFDEFTGYSSSLKRVSFNGNREICSGFVVIDNVTYQGFAYG